MSSNKNVNYTNGFSKKPAIGLLIFLAINSLPGYTQTFNGITTTVAPAAITTTAGDDNLIVRNSSDVTVTGNLDFLGGADDVLIDNSTLSITGASNLLFGAGALDILDLNNAATLNITNDLRGNDGRDLFRFGGTGVSTLNITRNLNLGGGDDELFNGVAADASIIIGNNLVLGGGADIFSLGNNSSANIGNNFNTNGGADQVLLDNDSFVSVGNDMNLGGGDDTVTLDIDAFLSITNNMSLGAGNDQININDDSFLNVNSGNFNAGTGNDQITLDDTAFFDVGGSFNTEAGTDSITLNGDSSLDAASMDLGADNDSITISDTADINIDTGDLDTGDGGDNVFVQDNGLLMVTGELNLGTGTDSLTIQNNGAVTTGGNLTLNSGGDLVRVINDANLTIGNDLLGGDGNEFITIENNASLNVTGSISLSTGNNTFNINDDATVQLGGDLTMGNGLFTDTLTISNDASLDLGSNSIAFGPGSDTFRIINNGTPSIVAGVINGGVGTDTFDIFNGTSVSFSGTDTSIINFENLLIDTNSTFSLVNDGAGVYNNAFSDIITVSNNSTFTYDALGTGQLTTGSININTGSLFQTSAFNSASPLLSDTFNADLFIDSTSTFAPGRVTNINGNFSTAGTTQIMIDTAVPLMGVAGQVNSPINVTGNVIFTNNLLLNDASDSGPAPGTEYTVINWTGTDSGTFDNVNLADGPSYLVLNPIYNANSLVIQILAGTLDCSLTGLSDNAHAACVLVNNAVAAMPTGDASDVIDQLFSLSDAGQRAALEQIHPASHFVMERAMLNANNIFVGTLRQRMGELRRMRPESKPHRFEESYYSEQTAVNTGLPYIPYNSAIQQVSANSNPANTINNTPIAFDSAPILPDENISIWARGIGSITEQESYNRVLGNSNLSYGGALGIDYKTPIDLTFGASVGFIQNEINQRGSNFDGDASSTQFALYSTFAKPNFYIDGILSFGIADNDTSRKINFGSINRTADGDYNSFIITGRVETGYDIQFGPVEVGPIAALEYNHLIREGFTETGAGSLNVSMNSEDRDYFKGEIGARIATSWSNRANTFMLVPEATLRYQRQFLNQDADMNYSLFGVNGIASGIMMPRNSILGTVGATAFITPKGARVLHSLFAYYSNVIGIGSIGYMQHTLNVGYKIKF